MKLKILNLSNNYFTGISSEIWNIKKKILNLFINYLTGPVQKQEKK
jgi:hypothetical protein